MKQSVITALLALVALTGQAGLASASTTEDIFGPNVIIFSPQDNMQAVAFKVNALHDEMFHDQFSRQRYAVLFLPGDYREAGLLNVPYYMQIAGLGRTPYEVQLSNIHTPAPLRDDNGTCTFWRSAENLSVVGPETYDEPETFKWAVSQAAPARRLHVARKSVFDWFYGDVFGIYNVMDHFTGRKNLTPQSPLP